MTTGRGSSARRSKTTLTATIQNKNRKPGIMGMLESGTATAASCATASTAALQLSQPGNARICTATTAVAPRKTALTAQVRMNAACPRSWSALATGTSIPCP